MKEKKIKAWGIVKNGKLLDWQNDPFYGVAVTRSKIRTADFAREKQYGKPDSLTITHCVITYSVSEKPKKKSK